MTDVTAELELDQLRAILDSTSDSVILHDVEARLVWMNRSARESIARMGIDVDALVGKPPREFPVPAALASAIEGMIAEARVRGHAARELLTPDGRWHDDNASLIRAGDGTPLAIAFISRDIHARKVSEARVRALAVLGTLPPLADALELLRTVAGHIVPDLADWAAVVADVDDPGAPPDATDVLTAPLALPGGRTAGLRLAMTTSGRRYDAEDRLVAEALVARTRQIAENARLTEALRRSEARFRIALGNSNIAVFEHRQEQGVCWIHNPDFGRFAEEPAERRPDDFAALARTPESAALIADAIAQRARLQKEIAFEARGEQRWAQLYVEPIVEGGAPVGVTGAAIDVTDARRAQDELAQALVFRERVLSVLGHDLGNPLAAVRGLAALLSRRDLDADTREVVGEIDRAARRMGEMIDTIIDFSRARFKGGLILTRRPADLADVTAGVIRELRAARPDRVVELVVDGDARGEWDAGRIAQAVSNLAGNALTHGAHDRPVRVAVTGGADVRIAVSNEGTPIPADVIPTLFEPFRRGRGAEEGRVPGLGLGLFIVREIAAAHGGDVTVESTPAATTFTLRVPRT